jgi:hypothetical protein
MRLRIAGACLVACLLLGARGAQAHHGGSGGGLGVSQSVLQLLYPPRSNVYYNFRFNSLRSDQGYSILNEVGGEYAFLDRFSIGLSVPIWTTDNILLPAVTKLGDMALLFKGEVWRSSDLGMQLIGGLNTGFPTGNDQVSVGAGAVTLSPYFSYLLNRYRFNFFVNLTSFFEASGDFNPTLSFDTGFTIPMVRGKLPVSFLISFNGVSYLENDTFTSGSFKGFVTGGFILNITDHWQMALQGRVSVVDALTLKTNIPFDDLATGLFDDIKGSFGLTLGYQF